MRNTIIGCHRIGIVMFYQFAYVQTLIKVVQSEDIIEYLVSQVPNLADGGTCIGCGIMEALQVSISNLMINIRIYMKLLSSKQIYFTTDISDHCTYMDVITS